MNAFCLVTFRPNSVWCDFLNSFTKYKIFIIVDDNDFDLSSFIIKYNKISFIKIENIICKAYGYIDSSFPLKKLISGWDKALCYFGVLNTNYDYIWLMEDDVLFYDESTLEKLDKKYIDDDLLSNVYDVNKDGSKNYWHWHRLKIEYQPPYYSAMVCAVRFSKKMMSCINDYISRYKTMFFIEAFFPTIAIKNNLKYSTPDEFNKIHYRYNFRGSEINKNDLYHPVKIMENHISFRKF